MKGRVEQRREPAKQDQATAADRRRQPRLLGPRHADLRHPRPQWRPVARPAVHETGRDGRRAPTCHNLDTRDRAREVQATAQELFAEATGAEQTLLSTNGSSLSVDDRGRPGRHDRDGRNGHESSFGGSGGPVLCSRAVYDEELEVAHVPLADDVARVLDAHPEAGAGLVFHAELRRHERHKTMRSRPGPSTSNPSSSASPTYLASIDGPIAAIARELLDGSASSTAASRDFNARSHRSSPR
jgi:hypothetical protein